MGIKHSRRKNLTQHTLVIVNILMNSGQLMKKLAVVPTSKWYNR